jgi:ubiquinone/menaquinone biosynthesis C-methylase UbiE
MPVKINWYEDETFWKDELDIVFNKTFVNFSFFEVSNLMVLTGNEHVTNLDILDLCCGVGRHAIEFARRGHNVTAVDLTEFCLQRGKDRADKLSVAVEWINADAREYVKPAAFDMIINLFNSFGYSEVQSDDIKILSNCFTSLKKGGKLVLELHSKEIIAMKFRETYSFNESGVTVEVTQKITKDWTWLEAQWSFVKQGIPKKLTFSQRLYAASELKELLAKCGFSKIDVYGNLKGHPFDHTATNLVIVAKK